MKKMTLLATALTVLIGMQILAPTKSEAQITCYRFLWKHSLCRQQYRKLF